ncbi:hypothetical protein LCGC14_1943630 [marine sediment metagenome]|uniref:Uncharacterized protein n=1 Tax=marine sediment metagenome TaxID=412755 RepID=A0A0F9FJI2_9ZZZZ
MPHIKDIDRDLYDTTLKNPAPNPGVLNYQLTLVIIEYLRVHGLKYKTCNDIVGALTNCLHEFQRQVQDPYEDEKIAENGNVYAAMVTPPVV